MDIPQPVWYYPHETFTKELKLYCPKCHYKKPMTITEMPHPDDKTKYFQCLRKKRCGELFVVSLDGNELHITESQVIVMRHG